VRQARTSVRRQNTVRVDAVRVVGLGRGLAGREASEGRDAEDDGGVHLDVEAGVRVMN
jgi:hypothetical protein